MRVWVYHAGLKLPMMTLRKKLAFYTCLASFRYQEISPKRSRHQIVPRWGMA